MYPCGHRRHVRVLQSNLVPFCRGFDAGRARSIYTALFSSWFKWSTFSGRRWQHVSFFIRKRGTASAISSGGPTSTPKRFPISSPAGDVYFAATFWHSWTKCRNPWRLCEITILLTSSLITWQLNHSISPSGLETRFDPTRQWPNQYTAQYNPASCQTADWRNIADNRYRSRPHPLNYQPQGMGMYMTEPYFSDSPPSSTSSYESPSPLTVNLRDLESNEDKEEAFLRQRLHIPPGLPVDLSSIPDPTHGERPTQKLQHLVELAIFGSPRKKLALQDIYAALANRFTWYRENQHDESWKVRIYFWFVLYWSIVGFYKAPVILARHFSFYKSPFDRAW